MEQKELENIIREMNKTAERDAELHRLKTRLFKRISVAMRSISQLPAEPNLNVDVRNQGRKSD